MKRPGRKAGQTPTTGGTSSDATGSVSPDNSAQTTTTAKPTPAPAPFEHGTLSRALVRRVALLVAVTAILLDAAAVVVARRVWLTVLDSELYAAQRNPIPAGAPHQQGPWASELDVQVVGGQVIVANAFDRDKPLPSPLTQDSSTP